MIGRLRYLLLSPFGIAKATLTALLLFTMLRYGGGKDAAAIGNIALLTSAGMFVAAFLRLGMDVSLTQEIAGGSTEASALRGQYVRGLSHRLVLALLLALIIGSAGGTLTRLGYVAVVVFGLSQCLATLIRITVNPNTQAFYDITSMTLLALYTVIATGAPADVVVLGWSTVYVVLTITALLKKGLLNVRPGRSTSPNAFFFTSELVILLRTAGTILALSAVLTDAELGTFRAVERVSYGSTFVLLIINNRVHYDVGRKSAGIADLRAYLRSYCGPAVAFFGAYVTFLLVLGQFPLGAVLVDNALILGILLVGYLVSSAAGPAASLLNVLGQEMRVLLAHCLAVGWFIVCWTAAYYMDTPTLVIVGMSGGLVISNAYLFGVLIHARGAFHASTTQNVMTTSADRARVTRSGDSRDE